MTFQVADAEALPYDNASYDVVLSSLGVMFAPDHEKSARELLRVCRPGGRIGLANWTPRGFIGQMFVVLGRHIPPPAGVTPPPKWGTEEHLQSLFGAGAASIHATPRDFNFRYKSPEHFIEVFRTWYGPVHKAFAALTPEKQQALHADLLKLIADFNVSHDGTMVVPSEYLEIVIVKR
jgi:SAM-dependent methyltransferase